MSSIFNGIKTIGEVICKSITHTKEKIKNQCETIHNFSKSIIGKESIFFVKSTTARIVGSTIGAASPEAMVAFSQGKKIACYATDSCPKIATKTRAWIVWSSGIGAALVVGSLSASLSHLREGMEGPAVQVLSYIVTAAGTIIGGMEGMKVAGTVFDPPSYSRMSFQSLLTDSAVENLRGAIFIPPCLTPLSNQIGFAFQLSASIAAYYAQPLTRFTIDVYHLDHSEKNMYNPGEVVKWVISQAYGSVQEGAQQITGNLPILKKTISSMIKTGIDKNIATNVIVRSLNEYFVLIQDSSVQNAVSALLASSTDSTRDELKKTIINLINEQLGKKFSMIERGLSYFIQHQLSNKISENVKKSINKIQQQEIQLVGMHLSGTRTMEDLLEIHAMCYLTFSLVQIKKTLFQMKESNPDLSDVEITHFYCNLNEILLGPYSSYRIASGVRKAMHWAIPLLIKHAQFMPQWALQINQEQVKNDTSPVEDHHESQHIVFTPTYSMIRNNTTQFPLRMVIEETFDTLYSIVSQDHILETVWNNCISDEEKEKQECETQFGSIWDQVENQGMSLSNNNLEAAWKAASSKGKVNNLKHQISHRLAVLRGIHNTDIPREPASPPFPSLLQAKL
jgi:hypothetical protein